MRPAYLLCRKQAVSILIYLFTSMIIFKILKSFALLYLSNTQW